jgi:hypothetical protein
MTELSYNPEISVAQLAHGSNDILRREGKLHMPEIHETSMSALIPVIVDT